MQAQAIAGEHDLGAYFPFLSVTRGRSWLIAMGGERRLQWTTIVTSCYKSASMKIRVLTAQGGPDQLLMKGARKTF